MSVKIPESERDIPWVQSLTRSIQEQARVIQAQAEEITQLKTTVQELRDEKEKKDTSSTTRHWKRLAKQNSDC